MGTYLIGNVKGPKGEDGVSPSAKVQQLSNGAIITITDADGTTSARIRDGVDADGHNIDLTIYPTKVEVNGQIAGLANTYATKTELTNRINAIDIPVSSVNGMTGAVVIPETDLTGYATQSWINQQGFITQVPVASVNGKTGNVSLSAYDVGALPDNTEIPTDTSDLTNNANFVDQSTLNTYLAAKQDALRAGAGIDITNNVVSAKQKLIVADATNFTVEEIGKFDNQTPTNEIYDRATKTTYYFAGREDLVVGEKIYYSPLLDFVSNGVSKDIDVYYIQLSGSGGFTTSGLVAANAFGGGFSGNYNDLTNKPDLSVYAETADLATVATSGDYDDLMDKPDLSVYATTTALGTGLARKQDTLTAGTNITIDANNVISAAAVEDELPTIASGDAGKVLTVNTTEDGVEWTTPSGGATYTAGNGIDITNDVISNNRYSIFPVSRESNGWYSFKVPNVKYL